MLKNNLQKQAQDAMRSGDSVRVSTLRLLSSALHNEEIAKQRDLTEEEEVAIIRRQIKQRQEAIEALRFAQDKLTSSSSADLVMRVEKEGQEAEILKKLLPEQMGEAELNEIVNNVVGELGVSEFGRVMGEVMKRVGGKADGKVVVEIVQKRLSTKH
ncbi:MAG: hypothetical protein A2700_01110 [Candidatus Blackburnbacteria bacterium RIFCSPHIGHO2_01_FULL_44_64]|uniref:Glutamyl-tRNA amidotransferase n=1 Tax=Candidatus Blackburnbacteria bacterium RIFCSPHIGHO2_02_FULL_44_20 TaxID=1797516 RepID=A0A1G1V5J4_9BACT|nr:MAG: hypothetical protein A2700_01110 [Candidatus Blackburnbacteria bacterium RIFCSPHIGHO2_01_FULL_44_64]OGY10675.1 MAG: hypothetical protein A3D26_00745 [Candidatus Blackburnbacteria bacterium RIFCSPHIGHO2_02_FULL_44_20]OGY11068.1 MAG: hypothetical protein A3E16_04660 [Candidatus Blackburnbacteria bacterium RIFCSPHIGHO2_12_FULL_44_25]OGY13453.1 MAG: hypothetical protein A3A62_03030 [Candidatus Blackburnbacteria bacterium RIFCSPLOWO2_01_FULL_44_43]OGY16631.1 MAG: hypothetical protein A3H88_0